MKILRDNFRVWWQKPRSADNRELREVSFLELFYDLIYVVLIAEVAHHLAHHLSWTGVWQFVFIFFFVIWSWINGMFYHELHGNNDISIRVFTFIQMILVGAMTVFVGRALSDGADGFAISFGIFELFFAFLWWRTGWHDKNHAAVSKPFTMFYLATAILMFWSTQLAQPAQFYVWGGILGVSMFLPLLMYFIPGQKEQVTKTNSMTPSSVERFGLITIIVLGEVIVSAIRGVAGFEEFSLRAGLILGLGILIAIGLWWLYFDFVSRRELLKGYWPSQLYTYLHMPLMVSIAGAGAVLLYIIEHSSEPISDQTRWMFVMFLSIALASISGLMRQLKMRGNMQHVRRKGYQALTLAALAIASLGFTDFGVLATLGLCVVVLLAPVYFGVIGWLRIQSA